MKNFILILSLLIMSSLQLSCSGDECSASANFIDDIDSDCVDDASDNCVGTYNPNQFDGDEDGMGAACDPNDGDNTIVAASVTTALLANITSEQCLLKAKGTWVLKDSECSSLPLILTLTQSDVAQLKQSWSTTRKAILQKQDKDLRCRFYFESNEFTATCLTDKDEPCLGTYEKSI